jgi:hypothetical protein
MAISEKPICKFGEEPIDTNRKLEREIMQLRAWLLRLQSGQLRDCWGCDDGRPTEGFRHRGICKELKEYFKGD